MAASPILVTGFGPFLQVVDNPSKTLAEGLDGLKVRGIPIAGRVLPVSFARAPAETARLVKELGARVVIGTGVAADRTRIEVESVGRCVFGDTPDIDGVVPPPPRTVLEERPSTLNPERVAHHLGAVVSNDAGTYVCNAWLFETIKRSGIPTVFIHLPPEGLSVQRALDAIGELIDEGLIDWV